VKTLLGAVNSKRGLGLTTKVVVLSVTEVLEQFAPGGAAFGPVVSIFVIFIERVSKIPASAEVPLYVWLGVVIVNVPFPDPVYVKFDFK
jgi:hypothetical protein